MNHTRSRNTVESKKYPRLRTKVLLFVNAALLIGVIALLAIDYRIQLNDATKNKLDKLDTEARIVAEAIESIEHHGSEAIQTHVDRVCERMKATTSPGHHIVIDTPHRTYQAQIHHRDSPSLLPALRQLKIAGKRTAFVDGHDLLVGIDRSSQTTTFISERLDDIYSEVRQDLRWRIVGLGVLGVVGAIVVNVILIRLVTRPISQLVNVVQRAATEDFVGEAKLPHTAELAFLADELNTMNQSLAIAKDRRDRTMQQARRIQSYLLPDVHTLCESRIHLIHQPADDVGGDYFDLRTIHEHVSILCLADVTGHGVPAAMTAAMLKILFNQAVDRTHDLSQILTAINSVLVSFLPAEVFATVIVARIDREHRVLTYASAGHEPAYLVGKAQAATTLDSTGMLLGVSKTCEWEEVEMDLDEGAYVILCTDGLAETMSPDGELLGRKRLLNIVEGSRLSPKSNKCEAIIASVSDFRENGVAADDITVVCIEA